MSDTHPDPVTPERKLLTVAMAAERMCVSPRTIYHWIADKQIEVCYTVSGQTRVYADSLIKLTRDPTE